MRNELLFENSGRFIKYWNNFIIMLAMYNSLTIPIQIFYKTAAISWIQGYPITMVDAFVDLFFLIDIIVTFRTTFLDSKQSIEVVDPHVIGKRYLKSSFTIDFISSVPFNVLF